ncbi:MAG: ATPase [Chloroflexi bacterium]|nr:ATPase [Chloroflexota bacterium]
MRRGFFGVEGLDDLVPDGISYDTQILVEGDTGIGKSVLATQFLYEGLVVGDTCVYIACDEPPDVMRLNMASFRLGTTPYERAGRLIVVDAYARERSRERYSIPDPANLDEFFLYEKRFLEMGGNRPVRLVVDSLSTILSMAETAEIIEFNSNRLRLLRSREVFTLDSAVSAVLEEKAINALRHAYPMIINMRFAVSDGITQRYVQLGKLKSGQFQATQHPFTIDPRTGIVLQSRQA